MREGIGGTWLFQIVIVFILLFAGILAIAVNYARAFKVKSEIVSIIERGSGINTYTNNRISSYLNTVGYRTTGKCDLDETTYGNPNTMQTDGKALYCIKEVKTKKNADDLTNQAYFRVKVFFNIDVPIIGNWMNLTLTGTTKVINDPVT